MTEPANRVWWIVLNPNVIRELTGVLYDDQGEKVDALNGLAEGPLVRELAALADPTVDVSVAHGWDQAPAELRDRWGPGARRHG